MLAFIVAADEKNGIGLNNDLPWKLPADLKLFKQITSGHPVIMGRKTFESLKVPLPNRQNYVLTRDHAWSTNGVIVLNNLDSIKQIVEASAHSEVFCIGGAELYGQLMPFVSRIYLTRVHEHFDCDTFLPDIPIKVFKWKVMTSKTVDSKHAVAFTQYLLERIT